MLVDYEAFLKPEHCDDEENDFDPVVRPCGVWRRHGGDAAVPQRGDPFGRTVDRQAGHRERGPARISALLDRRIYAELVVKIAPGRGISIHDYALEAFGVAYPCIALRAGDSAFNADVWEVRRANANEKYTLLFVLDATLVGLTPEQTLTLQAQFPPKDRADQPVPFTNLKNRSFTPPRSIPNSGNMKAARK